MLFAPVVFIVAILLALLRRLYLKRLQIGCQPIMHSQQQTSRLSSGNKSVGRCNLKQRKESILSVSTGTTTPGLQSKLSNSASKSPGVIKQVHFADILCTNRAGQPQTKPSNSQSVTVNNIVNANNTQATKQVKNGNKSRASKTNAIDADVGSSNGSQKHLKSNISSDKKDDIAVKEVDTSRDDSVSFKLEETTNTSPQTKSASGTSPSKKQQPVQKRTHANATRQRYNSENGKLNYSSEQLFKMIAASCLSREEVEMAVETLLNKLESGEAQWNQPKSDPLLKLTNQLRDSEAALATESHNHEQTRSRLSEIKLKLQSERSSRSALLDELTVAKKELSSLGSTLDKIRSDMARQRLAQQKSEEDTNKVLATINQENAQLKQLLSDSSKSEDDTVRLRIELDKNLEHIRHYEMSNSNLNKTVQDLELQLDQMCAKKRSDDYEACAKIAELESDRVALESALKNHAVRLNEVMKSNVILENSLKELQSRSDQQDDLIRQRHVNETSMKKTLVEMERELRKLHEQLGSKSSINSERYRKEIDHFERELIDASKREQKLAVEMKQLREGLSELFPDLNAEVSQTSGDDWVHQYLLALRKLTTTVDELRRSNVSNKESHSSDSQNENSRISPSSHGNRLVVDKSTLTSQTNGRSLCICSPTDNGRSSRASGSADHEKKLMETRLVELETKIRDLEKTNSSIQLGGMSNEVMEREQQIKELTSQRIILEAQIKFGIASFRMERERTRQLEEELYHYKSHQRAEFAQ